MRRKRLLISALGVSLALCGFGAAAASAERPLVTEVTGSLKGGESSLATLGAKAVVSKEVEATVKGCKESTGPKDTNLCEATFTVKGMKQGSTACRSESASGKDPVETVLALVDLHLASEKIAGGELEPLLLFRMLGVAGEDELTVVCGTVKDKVKGVIGCLLSPGATTIPGGGAFAIACKQSATTHDPETGECEQECEWLKEHPFEANLGAGFEDAWMNLSTTGSLNFATYVDVDGPMLLVLEGDPNSPMLLVLEGASVVELNAVFKAGATTLAALGGKAFTGTSLEATAKACKESAGAKDTDACEGLVTVKGVKQGTISCRSESALGKDPAETILVRLDLGLATEKAASGELVPLLLLRVLGVAGEEELVLVCGTLKDRVRGVIGCLLTPGLATIVAGGGYEIVCKQGGTTHDPETGECEQECEWLKEHPFEANLGAGFEDAWMSVSATGSLNLSALIDD